MRARLLIFPMLLISIAAVHAQSLVGRWQLVKQTTCLEENASAPAVKKQVDVNAVENLPIVHFVDHQNLDENTKILNTKKNINAKHFLYKLDSATLYILDKRSRTISETYNIDSWQRDSLILSNTLYPCETRVFVKIP